MLWIDRNFDYSDQLARKYIKYKGEYYDVGTVCKIKGHYGPVLVRFLGWKYGNRGCFATIENGKSHELYNSYGPSGVMDYCLEIVHPVRINVQPTMVSTSNDRDKPPSWDVEVAWIWYIAIMLVTVIFKDRIGLWILESFIFFCWKEGFFKGGKKK